MSVSSTATPVSRRARVPEELAGKRLDLVAARLFPEFSRARLQSWIKSGALTVNGQSRRPRDPLAAGDELSVEAELAAAEEWSAQALPLDIVFEDEHLLVLNKAADTVVHPAAGHRAGTLLNGLLHHSPNLEQLPRAGIVHRLDKDTTGLLVVAKTLTSHTALVRQLQERAMGREYQAVVQGALTGGGRIEADLGRHPAQRKKRAVVSSGQHAVTHYRLVQRFRAHSHLWVKLETGRTHQIRVHLAHVKHPIVGDALYGGRPRLPAQCSAALVATLQGFKRQALHATRLSLTHPVSQEALSWTAPCPPDMERLLFALAEDAQSAADVRP